MMQPDRSSSHPGKFDRDVLDKMVQVLGPVMRRMWPCSLEGLEHVPEHDRFMVVANHSGMGTAELWAGIVAWYEQYGDRRPIAGMAHPAAFRVPILRDVLEGVGAVEATREGAAKAREAGVPLLIFPGGDHEAARPVWQARRVDFAGRKGWIRLAREHKLDIVPLCITGSHITLPVLMRGRTLSWMIGTRWLGVHRAPLPALSLITIATSLALTRAVGISWVWGALVGWLSIGATIMVPWIPSEIGFHFLPRIAACDVEDADQDDEIYERVVSALQKRLSASS